MTRGRPDACDVPTTGRDRSNKLLAQKPSLIASALRKTAALARLGLIGAALSAAIGGPAFAQSPHPVLGYHGVPVVQRVSGLKTQAANDQVSQLVTRILAETSLVWTDVLPQQKGIAYAPPELVLYDRTTRSACGPTFTAIGPFYCPLDRKIYLDTSFFSGAKAQLGSAGDLAYTFLLAHEVGHHVQNELGILNKAQEVRRSAFGTRGNPISIRVELMADCYAGVWAWGAQSKYHLISPKDVAKLDATAQAIGDDRLEQAAQGIVVATTFTHGTSSQRSYWFELGAQSGRIDACNTFAPQDSLP
jgi:predicted metalloprotease